MGWEGKPWTWRGHWDGESEIKERLDRALCSQAWWLLYPSAKVTHVENLASDHCMVLVDTHPVGRKLRKKVHF